MKKLLIYGRFSGRVFVCLLLTDLLLSVALFFTGYWQWRQDHPIGLLLILPLVFFLLKRRKNARHGMD